MSKEQPFIKPGTTVTELSLRCVLLAVILTIVLAMSNAYLALKIGMLTSASIPAAVISMAILRFFKDTSVLENNLVQTAASAGEAVAGGIVYTIPALIIIHYWTEFSYWENFFIAAIGGTLGVIFSVPLRRILVRQPDLPFPEGQAIAEVLKTSSTGSVKELMLGGGLGALFELLQTGLKVIANNYQVWFSVKRTIVGFGLGFSTTLIGAGYLIGFELCLSIFLGAIVGWVIAVPVFSELYPSLQLEFLPYEAVNQLWNAKIRYLGIGAMLMAGLWAFLTMVKPLTKSIMSTKQKNISATRKFALTPRTDKDIPMVYLLLLASAIAALMFIFFQAILPVTSLGFSVDISPTVIFLFVIYIFVIGFLFAVITAFFSGLVGVTASPGSSIIIAGMLLLGWLLTVAMFQITHLPLTQHQIHGAEAITIIIGSVVTGIAAISNDNIQDLKVGYLLGATPWKQQVMLLLGVIVAAMIIPPVMQLLYSVYGIADVLPDPRMDPALSLPAPPAALMAAITKATFRHGLPWTLLIAGAFLAVLFIPLTYWLKKRWRFALSVLGFAIGIYLPMTSTVPLFIGGVLSKFVKRRLAKEEKTKRVANLHKGILFACGLVAGAALMDVLLAIPFSLSHSSDVMQLDFLIWDGSTLGFAILSTVWLVWFFYRLTCGGKSLGKTGDN